MQHSIPVVARIQYRWGDYDLSLFVRPARPESGGSVKESLIGGYRVLSWQRSGLEYVVVAPSEAEGLRERLLESGH